MPKKRTEETTEIATNDQWASWSIEKTEGPATSFDLATVPGRMAVVNCMNAPAETAEDLLPPSSDGRLRKSEPITVEHILRWRSVTEDDYGELKEVERHALVGPDGRVVQTTGELIHKSIVGIASVFGPPPWRPAVIVKLVAAKSKKPSRSDWHSLEIVGVAEEAADK